MITNALLGKLMSLALIMLLGFVLVKLGLVKAEESRTLSAVSVYILTPCMIINAFQVDYSPEILHSLLIATAVSVMLMLMMISITGMLRKPLRLNPVDRVSAIYSNSGNLLIPLVSYVLGDEWIIYTTAYTAIQILLLWSHAKTVVCNEKSIDLKKILTNVNFISVWLGIVVFLTGFRFPEPAQIAMASLSSMVGPISMIIVGMIIGGMELKKMLSFKRAFVPVCLRLLVYPLCAILFFKLSGVASTIYQGEMIMLILLMATATPSGTTIVRIVQLYGKGDEYASVINVLTTIACLVTMPLVVAIYQAVIAHV